MSVLWILKNCVTFQKWDIITGETVDEIQPRGHLLPEARYAFLHLVRLHLVFPDVPRALGTAEFDCL